MGCIMMRKCHLNTCPVGVATQDPELRKRFAGKPEHIVNFMRFIAQEVREYMAELGFRTFDEMVGRVDMIEMDNAVNHYKLNGLDFSKVLYKTDETGKVPSRCIRPQEHDFSLSLDKILIEKSAEAINNGKKIEFEQIVKNYNRTVGATLSAEVSKKYGSKGMPEDTLKINFTGSAGQSFGAFLAPGITFILKGDANDYFGKGLSGGKLIVRVQEGTTFLPHKNIISGNVNLFGATSGEAYINGRAGERFCVRNSALLRLWKALETMAVNI
jgi:hypothetical protein